MCLEKFQLTSLLTNYNDCVGKNILKVTIYQAKRRLNQYIYENSLTKRLEVFYTLGKNCTQEISG